MHNKRSTVAQLLRPKWLFKIYRKWNKCALICIVRMLSFWGRYIIILIMTFSYKQKEIQLSRYKSRCPISNTANSFNWGCYWLQCNQIRHVGLNKKTKKHTPDFYSDPPAARSSSICFMDWIMTTGLWLWLECFKEAKGSTACVLAPRVQVHKHAHGHTSYWWMSEEQHKIEVALHSAINWFM